MLVLEDASVRVPLAGSPDELGLDVLFRLEIGEIGGCACWAVEVGADARSSAGTRRTGSAGVAVEKRSRRRVNSR
jgi:hypothetical protein